MTRKTPTHPEILPFEDANRVTDMRFERLLTVARQRQRGLMVLMENLENPFNLNAIARTCDALGIQEVAYTTQASIDPNQEGDIASRSATKWMTYHHYDAPIDTTLSTLKQDGWHILATVADEQATVLHATDLTHDKLVVLVGNERKGISPTALACADSKVMIPMVGMVQSLNVSVATALVLYEITRQRRDKGNFLVSDDEAMRLAQAFVRRSAQPTKRHP